MHVFNIYLHVDHWDNDHCGFHHICTSCLAQLLPHAEEWEPFNQKYKKIKMVKYEKRKCPYLITGLWSVTRYRRWNPLIIDNNRTDAFWNNIFVLSFGWIPIFIGDCLCLRIRDPILNGWLSFWIILQITSYPKR